MYLDFWTRIQPATAISGVAWGVASFIFMWAVKVILDWRFKSPLERLLSRASDAWSLRSRKSTVQKVQRLVKQYRDDEDAISNPVALMLDFEQTRIEARSHVLRPFVIGIVATFYMLIHLVKVDTPETLRSWFIFPLTLIFGYWCGSSTTYGVAAVKRRKQMLRLQSAYEDQLRIHIITLLIRAKFKDEEIITHLEHGFPKPLSYRSNVDLLVETKGRLPSFGRLIPAPRTVEIREKSN